MQKVSEFELSNSLTLIKTSFQYSRLETFKEGRDGLLYTSPVYLFSNKTSLQNITVELSVRTPSLSIPTLSTPL